MKSTIIDELKYRRELLDKALAELQAWNHNAVLRVKISSVLAHDDDEYQAEHAALLAVAEAAKKVYNDPYTTCKCAEVLKQALATLAQTQKGE